MKIKLLLAVLPYIFVYQVCADVTLFSDFNDNSSFDAAVAAGNSQAMVYGIEYPSIGVGVEGTAFMQTDHLQGITYEGTGNVGIVNGTSGGITIGFWFKMPSPDSWGRGEVFEIRSGMTLDYLLVDVGNYDLGAVRVRFKDSTNTLSILRTGRGGVSTSQWNYIALTIDLNNEELSMYLYDQNGVDRDKQYYDENGTAVAGSTRDIPVDSWDIFSAFSTIRVGGGVLVGNTESIYVDQLSIHNTVLSQADIEDQLVNGQLLQSTVPEPSSMLVFVAGCFGCIYKRNKKLQ